MRSCWGNRWLGASLYQLSPSQPTSAPPCPRLWGPLLMGTTSVMHLVQSSACMLVLRAASPPSSPQTVLQSQKPRRRAARRRLERRVSLLPRRLQGQRASRQLPSWPAQTESLQLHRWREQMAKPPLPSQPGRRVRPRLQSWRRQNQSRQTRVRLRAQQGRCRGHQMGCWPPAWGVSSERR